MIKLNPIFTSIYKNQYQKQLKKNN